MHKLKLHQQTLLIAETKKIEDMCTEICTNDGCDAVKYTFSVKGKKKKEVRWMSSKKNYSGILPPLCKEEKPVRLSSGNFYDEY